MKNQKVANSGKSSCKKLLLALMKDTGRLQHTVAGGDIRVHHESVHFTFQIFDDSDKKGEHYYYSATRSSSKIFRVG